MLQHALSPKCAPETVATADGNHVNPPPPCRHVGILYIKDTTFRMEPVPLKTVRPFVMDTVLLSKTGIHPRDDKQIVTYLVEKVREQINATLNPSPSSSSSSSFFSSTTSSTSPSSPSSFHQVKTLVNEANSDNSRSKLPLVRLKVREVEMWSDVSAHHAHSVMYISHVAHVHAHCCRWSMVGTMRRSVQQGSGSSL